MPKECEKCIKVVNIEKLVKDELLRHKKIIAKVWESNEQLSCFVQDLENSIKIEVISEISEDFNMAKVRKSKIKHMEKMIVLKLKSESFSDFSKTPNSKVWNVKSSSSYKGFMNQVNSEDGDIYA